MSQYGSASELDKRTLIVCALEVETQGQLEDYDVLYTGVGKVNATFELTRKFGKYGSYIPYDMVINYGTAGSRKIKKGQLVDCTKFIQRDMDVTGLGFMRGETPFEPDVNQVKDRLKHILKQWQVKQYMSDEHRWKEYYKDIVKLVKHLEGDK